MDSRFSKAANDPRFSRGSNKKTKVKVDDRFQSMFKNKDFQTTVSVDKYGRKGAASRKEDLSRFYDVEGEDEEGDEEGDEESEEEPFVAPETKKKKDSKKKKKKEVESEEEESSEEEVGLSDLEGEDLLARARGEGPDMSSSDEETSDSEAEDEVAPKEMIDQFTDDDRTAILGAFNMDWDQVDATDILAVLQSFVPAGGAIESVAVHATKEGAEILEREKIRGPQGLFEEEEEEDEVERLERLARGEEFTEEGEEIDQDALRAYQKRKMGYHVALVRCNSVETAISLYTQCDGLEFERSSNVLDLRYVADTYLAKLVKAPRDTSSDVPVDYEAPVFATAALQQTKVELAWDQDDPKRNRLTMKDFAKGDYKDEDYTQYLASGSEDEGSDDGGPNLKALLGGGDSEEEDEEEGMEISWNVGLDNAAKDIVQRVKDKKQKELEGGEETVYEKYLRERGEKKSAARREARQKAKAEARGDKGEDPDEGGNYDGDAPAGSVFNDPFFSSAAPKKRNKKKLAKIAAEEKAREEADEDKRKAELELLVMDEQDDGRGYNLQDLVKAEETGGKKKKLSKRNKKRSKNSEEIEADQAVPDLFQMNTEDDRFKALGGNVDFHIDPTSTQYKKTKGMKEMQDAVVEKSAKGSKDGHSKKSRVPEEEKVSKVSSKRPMEKEKSTDSLVAAAKRGAAENEQRKKKQKKW